MANAKTGGRWVLDSTGEVVATGTFVKLRSLLFYADTDEYTFVLNDGGNSKLIAKGKVGDVSVNGHQCTIDFGVDGQMVDGLYLNSISSGSTLVLYLGKL
jgi:hypothetical protein